MNVPLDTHTFIWYIEGNSKLTEKARDAIIGCDQSFDNYPVQMLWKQEKSYRAKKSSSVKTM
jgi:PIN domain nuclease of toxin-antitoxin system